MNQSAGLRSVSSILSVPVVRRWVGKARLWYYLKLCRRWRYAESDMAFDATIDHNLKGLNSFGTGRTSLLIKPLSVIESLDKDTARVLVVGPRNEHDLLILAGNGFRFGNVSGLDLMSYSPRIDVGDMHAMEYADDAWDAIVCGWTLSYSRFPEKVAKELIRVTKSGGIIAIGVEYSTLGYDDSKELVGYSIDDEGFQRINSVQDILGLFGDKVGDVFFMHDAPMKRSHTRDEMIETPSAVAVIFSIDKNPDET